MKLAAFFSLLQIDFLALASHCFRRSQVSLCPYVLYPHSCRINEDISRANPCPRVQIPPFFYDKYSPFYSSFHQSPLFHLSPQLPARPELCRSLENASVGVVYPRLDYDPEFLSYTPPCSILRYVFPSSLGWEMLSDKTALPDYLSSKFCPMCPRTSPSLAVLTPPQLRH